LRRRQDEFREHGAELLAICFDAPERAARYVREQGLDVPLLLDPERRVYHAYGLEPGAFWRFLLPPVILGYLRLLSAGRRLQRPEEDPLQLGGDFVVDPAGRLALVHPSKDPTDRPTVAELLAAVEHAAGAGLRGE
jgi:peroxiredoxin